LVVQPITGFWVMGIGMWDFTQSWLMLGTVFYVVAAVSWMGVVWVHMRVREAAADIVSGTHEEGHDLGEACAPLMKIWTRLAWVAVVSLIVTFYLMVVKPEMW